MWIKTNWKILRDGNIRPSYLPPEKLYAGQEATARIGQGTMDWFKLVMEYVKAVYCHPDYITYTQSSVLFSSVQSISPVCLFATP